jgi:hypothetical protein
MPSARAGPTPLTYPSLSSSLARIKTRMMPTIWCEHMRPTVRTDIHLIAGFKIDVYLMRMLPILKGVAGRPVTLRMTIFAVGYTS